MELKIRISYKDSSCRYTVDGKAYWGKETKYQHACLQEFQESCPRVRRLSTGASICNMIERNIVYRLRRPACKATSASQEVEAPAVSRKICIEPCEVIHYPGSCCNIKASAVWVRKRIKKKSQRSWPPRWGLPRCSKR